MYLPKFKDRRKIKEEPPPILGTKLPLLPSFPNLPHQPWIIASQVMSTRPRSSSKLMQACKSPLERKNSLSQQSWNIGRSKKLWLADSKPSHLRISFENIIFENIIFLRRCWFYLCTSPQPGQNPRVGELHCELGWHSARHDGDWKGTSGCLELRRTESKSVEDISSFAFSPVSLSVLVRLLASCYWRNNHSPRSSCVAVNSKHRPRLLDTVG